MKIFLDDLYETERKSLMPEGYVGVKNFAEFKKLLEDTLARGEKIEGLNFDSELGEGEMSGWEVVDWLIGNHLEVFTGDIELTAHSSTEEGREIVAAYFERGRRKYKELIEAKDRSHPWGEMEKIR